jgi:hypothetical protein
MGSPGPIDLRQVTSVELRMAALEAVLNSGTFARSEQLKSFLRFVGELEISGRGAEISEYAIGVNALNRPEGFSTSEDSTVRTRAHLLRQKLQEVYERELRDAEIRVELPRGSYAPRFVPLEPPPPPLTEAAPAQPYPRWKLALIAASALIIGIAVTMIAIRSTSGSLDPLIRQAWGPLVEPNASVMICLSNPVHLAVRPLEKGSPPSWYAPFPGNDDLKGRFAKVQPYWKHSELFVEFTEHATRLGEAFALAKASRVLGAAGVQPEVLTTRSIHSPAFSGRNLILLGTPEFSGVARAILERAAFTIAYDQRNQDLAVVEKPEPNGTAHSFLPVRSGGGRGTIDVSYGLVTMFPSEGSAGGRHRTIIISGASSAGSHGAMEYFTSPPSLEELLQKLRAEGHSGFPPAFQVVVRCPSAGDNLRSFHYAAHRVLDAQSLQR